MRRKRRAAEADTSFDDLGPPVRPASGDAASGRPRPDPGEIRARTLAILELGAAAQDCRERAERWSAARSVTEQELAIRSEQLLEELNLASREIGKGQLADAAYTLATIARRLSDLLPLAVMGAGKESGGRKGNRRKAARAIREACDLRAALEREREKAPRRLRSAEAAMAKVLEAAADPEYRRRFLPSVAAREREGEPESWRRYLPSVEAALRKMNRALAPARRGERLLAKMEAMSPKERAALARRVREVRAREQVSSDTRRE